MFFKFIGNAPYVQLEMLKGRSGKDLFESEQN